MVITCSTLIYDITYTACEHTVGGTYYAYIIECPFVSSFQCWAATPTFVSDTITSSSIMSSSSSAKHSPPARAAPFQDGDAQTINMYIYIYIYVYVYIYIYMYIYIYIYIYMYMYMCICI